MSGEKDTSRQSDKHPVCRPDVARARWSLLSQVLKHKQLDNIEVQQVSVRRFSSFNLFTRTRVRDLEIEEPGDEMWFEYRSATFPQFRAFLRDNLGPIKVNEVLNSFDNTGNVYKTVKAVFCHSAIPLCMQYKLL
uniref:Calmodulin-lysine N-methyltransferase n=1 Tax=Lepisosteus oculatus TaxID=7918 RepID=W5NHW1_LEPOC